jgi:hypothetical protein
LKLGAAVGLVRLAAGRLGGCWMRMPWVVGSDAVQFGMGWPAGARWDAAGDSSVRKNWLGLAWLGVMVWGGSAV